MRRYLSLLSVLVLLLATGCGSREIRLWPLIDVERPAGADGGTHTEVLWPIVEVDTTDDVEFAVRPLVSYDSGEKKGSFLWPLGWFDLSHPAFSLFPLYSWRQWDEEKRKGHHFVLPFGGYLQNGDSKSWWIGPGLFGRYDVDAGTGALDVGLIPPYMSYSDAQGHERTIGALIPPFYYHRKGDDERSLLLLNYYRERKPRYNSDVFFPLVWWRDRTWRVPDKGERRWSERSLFPILGRTQLTSDYDEEPVRRSRIRALWPLLSIETGPEARGSHILFLAGWEYEDGRLDNHRFLPFYTKGRAHFSIPLLGYAKWDRDPEATGTNYRSGWAAWPFVQRRQRYSWFGPRDKWVLRSDSWNYLLGLVGHEQRTDREDAYSGHGHHLWPLYNYDYDLTNEETPRTRLHILAGFARRATGPDYSLFAFPWPFGKYERTAQTTHHRLWPLYRYDARGEERDSVDFTALAELVRVRHGMDISEGPGVILRPFTYQETPDGDYQLRLLWKLFESSHRSGEDRWALHPLIYRRSSEQESTWLFLGGLLGTTQRPSGRSYRLLWLFDI